MTTALILSGGGARAAYQVGVLKAVAELLPKQTHNPFPIICGTSAGAINALAIASSAGRFRLRVRKLETIWRTLKAEDIYRTDLWGVCKNTLRLGLSLFNRGSGFGTPVALLDNTPLRELLTSVIRFRHIDEALASGELDAINITAMNYTSGLSVNFFQGRHDNWQRTRRVGLRTGLTIDHLIASTSIPTIFPATKIGHDYYGDGAMRQLKPISPALHLGANRVFIVGVSDNQRGRPAAQPQQHSPSVAQMIAHMLNSAFIDSIESDLETLQTVNQVARLLQEKQAQNGRGEDIPKPIDYLCISPSVAINEIADAHFDELPTSLKLFLRATGGTAEGGGSSATSLLLFEPGFCNELINLGYRDALQQSEDILSFFALNSGAENKSRTADIATKH